MHPFLQKNHRLLFYATWLLLGLMQAGLTELQDDEAYYWVYSQYLDWGYFDHPPMIGLLVKMGYSLFPNELGVRLWPLIFNLLSLLVIEKLISRKDPYLFYTIALSIAVLQLTGFLAVPDIPLIFFTALFFLCYQRLVGNASLFNSILLGISIALLFYSKYHAILIVLFTILSNLKLLTRYHIYIAGLVALLLFAPHLWWQYQHDWVSFRYHLFESNVNAYKFSFTGDYILGQLLLPGPIAGFVLLPVAFLYKPRNETEKALRFMMIGIYVFFLLSSFRGKVEANWTSPVLVALIVLSHQSLLDKVKWRKILYKLLPITLILVLAARIIMIADILPVNELRIRYHGWKEWPKEMRTKTAGLPIVFSNSYQRASKYWFYSGQITYSQNWYRERRNNFNFWPVEDSLLGKPVYFMDKYQLARFPDSIKTPIGFVGYKYDDALVSLAKVQFNLDDIQLSSGQKTTLSPLVSMPANYRAFLLNHQVSDTIRIGVFDKRGWIKDLETGWRIQNLVKEEKAIIPFDPRLPRGKYFLLFTIQVEGYNATHNSRKIGLQVD